LVFNPQNKQYLFDMDAIWNYQSARRILYGQIPYRDFAMLQMPFSAQLNALFLYIFSDKLIVMRWIESFIAAINGLVIYRIMRVIGKNHLLAFVYTCLFLFPIFLYPQNNYSWYAVLFLSIALLGELMKIKNDGRKNIYWEIWIGISLGFLFITKQNIGFFGLFASIIFLVYNTFNINYKNSRQYLPLQGESLKYLAQSLALKMLGWMCIVGIEVIYLSINLDLGAFIRGMAINMIQFAEYSTVPYVKMFSYGNLIIGMLALLIPVIIIASFIQGVFGKQTSAEKKIILLVSIYALANFSMVIPIADLFHFIFAMPLSIVAIASIFYRQPLYEIKPNSYSTNVVIIILVLGILSYIMLGQGIQQTTIKSDQTIKHYEQIPMSPDTFHALTDIDNLIVREEQSGKQVYFLNSEAAFYLIPLDKFSYRYDSIISGSPGEEETIQLLSSSQEIVVIIRGQGMEPNWQETRVIENYVRNTMHYNGSLDGFDIFTK
jgi:hypothetical protein